MPSLSELVLWGLLSPQWERAGPPRMRTCISPLSPLTREGTKTLEQSSCKPLEESSGGLFGPSQVWPSTSYSTVTIHSAEQLLRLTYIWLIEAVGPRRDISGIFLYFSLFCFTHYLSSFPSDSLPGWFCLPRGHLAMSADIFGCPNLEGRKESPLEPSG